MIYRQGDVLLRKIKELPKEKLSTRTNNIIVEGESTGHAHRLIDGEVLESMLGGLFVKIDSQGKVVHEEHNEIDLDRGVYEVVLQREYTAGDVRRVLD